MNNIVVVGLVICVWVAVYFFLVKRLQKLRSAGGVNEFKIWIMKNLHVIAALILSTLLVPLVAYIAKFGINGVSGDPSQWGQMGDFFGGMLNPALAFASFMALLYTIRIQSEELKLTRDELSKTASAAQKSSQLEEQNLTIQSSILQDKIRIAQYSNLSLMINKHIDNIYNSLNEPILYRDGNMLVPSGTAISRVYFLIGEVRRAAQDSNKYTTHEYSQEIMKRWSKIDTDITSSNEQAIAINDAVVSVISANIDLHIVVELCLKLEALDFHDETRLIKKRLFPIIGVLWCMNSVANSFDYSYLSNSNDITDTSKPLGVFLKFWEINELLKPVDISSQ